MPVKVAGQRDKYQRCALVHRPRRRQGKCARLIVSGIVLDALEELKMPYPKTSVKRRRELLSIREQLAKRDIEGVGAPSIK
jgi:23S rRNA C2498 (ribose-2'-O)-methylase RlmM